FNSRAQTNARCAVNTVHGLALPLLPCGLKTCCDPEHEFASAGWFDAPPIRLENLAVREQLSRKTERRTPSRSMLTSPREVETIPFLQSMPTTRACASRHAAGALVAPTAVGE